MKSPAHQREAIIDYFLGQSPDGTEVYNTEKVASERIYGIKHDVWDVHASDGRWWVITNPTNLYPQETTPTPSMDHALALHIGVTARVLAREHLEAPVDGPPREFVARTWRKYEQAADALNRADEAEDFQAVGMRLRECLIAFAQETAADMQVPEGTEAPKRSDFKGWAQLLSQEAAPGSHGTQIRSYLRTMSREVWDLVSWLTHAANARRSDADTAVEAVSHLIQVFSLALLREKQGQPVRCAICGSYQVTLHYRHSEDGDLCRSTCCARPVGQKRSVTTHAKKQPPDACQQSAECYPPNLGGRTRGARPDSRALASSRLFAPRSSSRERARASSPCRAHARP